jgi:hypothetical protein
MVPLALAPALALLSATPAFLFDFMDDANLVIVLLVFFALYNILTKDFIKSPLLAMLVTILIVFTLVVPYDWFKYFMFVVLILYGFFGAAKPSEWFK